MKTYESKKMKGEWRWNHENHAICQNLEQMGKERAAVVRGGSAVYTPS
jgi:hypothetical protein